MNVFNEGLVYHASSHAIKQLAYRTGLLRENEEPTRDWWLTEGARLKKRIENFANKGKLLIEVEDYRYILCGEWYLPCIKHEDMPSNHYNVKSVLNWEEMVEHRFQRVIDNYHLYRRSC